MLAPSNVCNGRTCGSANLAGRRKRAAAVRPHVLLRQPLTPRSDQSSRALGVERQRRMESLARIGVDRGEERRIGDAEIRLVESDLCRVLGIRLPESVAL